MTFYISPQCQSDLGVKDSLKAVFQLEGEVFRAAQNRETLKVCGKNASYFIKRHKGVGWKEIVKNIFFGRPPILSAKNEWRAIQKLHELGIDTMVLCGYGATGCNPAKKNSFLITEALEECESLETLSLQWQKEGLPFQAKQALIETLAQISKKMHQAGINHRDYYLCHFLMPRQQQLSLYVSKAPIKLFLIDLHRAQIRGSTPKRWRIKDLAGLYFSTLHLPISRADRFRFIRAYSDMPLRLALKQEGSLWQSVERKAQKLFQKALLQGIVPEVSR